MSSCYCPLNRRTFLILTLLAYTRTITISIFIATKENHSWKILIENTWYIHWEMANYKWPVKFMKLLTHHTFYKKWAKWFSFFFSFHKYWIIFILRYLNRRQERWFLFYFFSRLSLVNVMKVNSLHSLGTAVLIGIEFYIEHQNEKNKNKYYWTQTIGKSIIPYLDSKMDSYPLNSKNNTMQIITKKVERKTTICWICKFNST